MSGRFRNLPGTLALGLLLLGGEVGAQSLDQMQVSPNAKGIEVTWSDSEESIRGALTPAALRAGDELSVTLFVGSFQGSFDGPVEVTLRRPGAPAEVHTVRKGVASWHTTFKLEEAGSHVLDVRIRTTHDKLVHAHFEVGDPRVPDYVAWLLLGTAAVAAFAFGLYRLRPGDGFASGTGSSPETGSSPGDGGGSPPSAP